MALFSIQFAKVTMPEEEPYYLSNNEVLWDWLHAPLPISKNLDDRFSVPSPHGYFYLDEQLIPANLVDNPRNLQPNFMYVDENNMGYKKIHSILSVMISSDDLNHNGYWDSDQQKHVELENFSLKHVPKERRLMFAAVPSFANPRMLKIAIGNVEQKNPVTVETTEQKWEKDVQRMTQGIKEYWDNQK